MNECIFFSLCLIASIEIMRQTNYIYKSFLTHLPLKIFSLYGLKNAFEEKKDKKQKNVTEIKFWRLINNEHRLQFTNPNRMRTKIECLNKCCVKLSTDSCNYGCNHEHKIAVFKQWGDENKRNGKILPFFFFSRINQIDWNELLYCIYGAKEI